MDTVKVRDIVQGRESACRFEGRYTYDDIRTEHEVTCDWELNQATAGIRVLGYLQADLLMECGRCLAEYQVPIRMSIDENYVFSQYVDPYEGRERELQAEDYYETVEEDGNLDLKDLVHQLLIMESTVRPTCGQPSCEG